MKQFHSILVALAMMGLLSGCVTSRRVNLMQEPGKHGVPEYTDTLSYEDYLIRTGDRLYVYVYSIDPKTSALFNSGGGSSASQIRQNMNNSTYGSYDLYSYLVHDDGTIDFPMLGRMDVRGKTTRQIKLLLEKELSTFITSYGDYDMMSVEVNVVARSFSVIGANGSGRFPIQREKVTIFEALAQAGDIGDFGDRSEVKIVREIEGTTVIKTFDVRSADIINSEFYYIEPNDVIYIRKIRGQAFGVNSAATTVSIVATTLAFGGFVYGIVTRIINAAKTK